MNLVYSTPWGKFLNSVIIAAFNTVTEDRLVQDVGFDGLNDQEERLIYTNGPSEDPAGDKYKFFVAAQGGVLNRYKNYTVPGELPYSFFQH